MVNIQIDIDEGKNKIVNMCKLVNSLESKQDAISKIIMDWGKLQSMSNEEIYNKVLDYFKRRWDENHTHDKKNWTKQAEERLKQAYKEYSDKINNFPNLMIKKYKVSKKFVKVFMEEENWTDDEDEMQETIKSEKKIKIKIFNEFQNLISDWQEEISKKYNCELEHDECFWFAKEVYGCLTIEYSGGKECFYYLDGYVKEVINEMIKIFRGSKSLRDVMDENKAYLDKIEKEEDESEGDPTAEEEEEADAEEELLGI